MRGGMEMELLIPALTAGPPTAGRAFQFILSDQDMVALR